MSVQLKRWIVSLLVVAPLWGLGLSTLGVFYTFLTSNVLFIISLILLTLYTVYKRLFCSFLSLPHLNGEEFWYKLFLGSCFFLVLLTFGLGTFYD